MANKMSTHVTGEPLRTAAPFLTEAPLRTTAQLFRTAALSHSSTCAAVRMGQSECSILIRTAAHMLLCYSAAVRKIALLCEMALLSPVSFKISILALLPKLDIRCITINIYCLQNHTKKY